MPNETLPLGKLPPDLLRKVLSSFTSTDQSVVQGPGIGLDSAIVDLGDRYLVVKSEPITFATDELGWYAIHVAANDVATTGAVPKWAMFTLLLPQERSDPLYIKQLFSQLQDAAKSLNISVIGGHTEITHGLPRPIVNTTLLAELEYSKAIFPRHASTDDVLIMTKGIPIEGTALLAREFPERLKKHLTGDELSSVQNMLFSPGISVLQDAQVAIAHGSVTAMHDPTEGGISAALWELSEATGCEIKVDLTKIIIPELCQKVCDSFGIDPLGAISSGSLLICCKKTSANKILRGLAKTGIDAAIIGNLVGRGKNVFYHSAEGSEVQLRAFPRDEIARIFEGLSS